MNGADKGKRRSMFLNQTQATSATLSCTSVAGHSLLEKRLGKVTLKGESFFISFLGWTGVPEPGEGQGIESLLFVSSSCPALFGSTILFVQHSPGLLKQLLRAEDSSK